MAQAYDRCPYGHKVLYSDASDGPAFAQTNMVGNTAFTTVGSSRRVEIIVECAPAYYCANQGDCAERGLRCVKSKRYAGRAVCADR